MQSPRAFARLFLLSAATFTHIASAQSMPGMDMSKPPQTLIDTELQHSSSGTSIEPDATPHPMLTTQRGPWMLMLHANIFIADTQQHATDNPTAPPAALCAEIESPCVASYRRGSDKLFSTNWIMPMAMRPLGSNGRYGQLTLRTMLSLEPATVADRQYPELFQQGETAFGRPIVDGQHPHNFVMELGALYDLRLGHHALLSLYAAPVGDPAIGPTAYPHRLSASEDPIAALGHHQQDSTHIAFNVFTAGLTWKTIRLEGSGFHGAEPTESRWNFEPSPNGHAVDSDSLRLTWSPTRNWSGQYSIAHITSPEALHPSEDQRRQTASVMYTRPIGAHHDTTSMPGMDMATPATGSWSTTFVWGQTKSIPDGELDNSYLLESLLNFHTRNYLWTRIESAARTTDLLLGPNTAIAPPESSVGHVQAYTLGYDRDFRLGHVLAAPGAQFTLYRAPDALVSTYGRTPFGAVAFVRFRLSH
ncbi:hypothetical protein [Granulicella sp. WH15]|uniref:hypothetical protein n=1 Tax=Granulicella sp. WH15 TaxID=2602070 RepID=UPI0015F2D880|nr:hypothetical protein [Granulicella sp. WH15]